MNRRHGAGPESFPGGAGVEAPEELRGLAMKQLFCQYALALIALDDPGTFIFLDAFDDIRSDHDPITSCRSGIKYLH